MNKKFSFIFSIIFFTLFFFTQIAFAVDSKTIHNPNVHHQRPNAAIQKQADWFSFSVDSEFLSRYVYQGQASSDGWVWQPSATVEVFNIGFNVWANYVLDDIPDQGKFNEIDLTTYYNLELGNLTIHPYLLLCFYPTDNELSLDYSADTDVKPSLHLAYTLGPIDFFTEVIFYAHPHPGALIFNFGLGFEHEFIENFGIETSALVALANSRFNRQAFGVNKTKFNHFTYSLGLPWKPIKGLTITPQANVSAIFSQDLRNGTLYPFLVWGGLDVSYDF
ncbi:MAG: hypothetical protein ABH859_06720 [Pseudomonadota bacterium]